MTSHLLTSIITQLSTLSSPFSSQPNNEADNDETTKSKNVLLTLHCLFPNDLLPALDIIDRQLIQRYRRHDGNSQNASCNEVFFVTSTNRANRQESKTYEVRLDAWNCSCPAFAMRVFQPSHSVDDLEIDDPETKEEDWFGGTLVHQKENITTCKHVLACVLAAKCSTVFGRGIGEDSVVGKEELAGLCAGFAG